MPGLVGGYGNFFLPLHSGAADMAKLGKKYLNGLIFKSQLIKNNLSFNTIQVNQNFNINQLKGSLGNFDLNNSMGSYLAGLIEGDGYISINNQNKIILGITFNIKDKPLANKLLNYIGNGTIVNRKSNSLELRFSSKDSLYKIIQLINGKFRTPKIKQLYNLIDWMNKNHIQFKFKNIDKLPIDNSSLISNNWLAGFIDADGHFYIRFSLKHIICKFSLEQRMIYPKTNESYLDILEKISFCFNIKLAIRNRINYKNNYYIIRIENQNSTKLLMNYLDNYFLLSSKYLDYLDWKKAFLIILNKDHFLEEGNKLIFKYKNSMNNKRTFYDWSHLNFF